MKQLEGWSPTARLVSGPLGMTSSHKGLRSYKEKDVSLKKGDVEEHHQLSVAALVRLDEETGTADCRMATRVRQERRGERPQDAMNFQRKRGAQMEG